MKISWFIYYYMGILILLTQFAKGQKRGYCRNMPKILNKVENVIKVCQEEVKWQLIEDTLRLYSEQKLKVIDEEIEQFEKTQLADLVAKHVEPVQQFLPTVPAPTVDLAPQSHLPEEQLTDSHLPQTYLPETQSSHALSPEIPLPSTGFQDASITLNTHANQHYSTAELPTHHFDLPAGHHTLASFPLQYNQLSLPSLDDSFSSHGDGRLFGNTATGPLKIPLDFGFKQLPQSTAALVNQFPLPSFNQQLVNENYHFNGADSSAITQWPQQNNVSQYLNWYGQKITTQFDPLQTQGSHKYLARRPYPQPYPQPLQHRPYQPKYFSNSTVGHKPHPPLGKIAGIDKRRHFTAVTRASLAQQKLMPVLKKISQQQPAKKIITRRRVKRSDSFSFFHHTLASDEDKWVAGCLLQCIYRKHHAVDYHNHLTLDGLVNFYTDGTSDQTFFIAVLRIINTCLRGVSYKHQILRAEPSDKTVQCNIAYDVFDCVSDKITEHCSGH